jgi:TonB family protein
MGSQDQSIRQEFILEPFSSTSLIFVATIRNSERWPRFVSGWRRTISGTGMAQRVHATKEDDAIAPDRDAQPLSRIPPEYPDHCWKKAKEIENAVLRFDVTERGLVENPTIVSSTNDCFNQTIIEAVESWIYTPKLVGQRLQRRIGVETAFEFQKSYVVDPPKTPLRARP